VAALGAGEGGDGDLEVFRAVRVGAQHQHLFARPVGMILDLVLHRGFARRNQHRLGIRDGQVDQPRFGRFMIVDRDVGEAARLQLVESDEEACVRLFIDQRVIRG
jgi:hypothetical protein